MSSRIRRPCTTLHEYKATPDGCLVGSCQIHTNTHTQHTSGKAEMQIDENINTNNLERRGMLIKIWTSPPPPAIKRFGRRAWKRGGGLLGIWISPFEQGYDHKASYEADFPVPLHRGTPASREGGRTGSSSSMCGA